MCAAAAATSVCFYYSSLRIGPSTEQKLEWEHEAIEAAVPDAVVRPTFSARVKRRATGNFVRFVLYQVPRIHSKRP